MSEWDHVVGLAFFILSVLTLIIGIIVTSRTDRD